MEVRVEQGLLRGQRLAAPGCSHEFDAFLGVPYAKPPLGPLRFRAPQPPEPWPGVRSALSYGPRCLQFEFPSLEVVGSEDCLYLNVYSPRVPGSDSATPASWPVMVWFHSGVFNEGDPGMNEHGPEHLCAKGVLMVSVGYRLGPFGFLSLCSKALPGNAGLKDAVAALRWIQDNIAAFGGDPKRVTLFGCSSGAALTDMLQMAPCARGLFHRAIAQSGAAALPWAWAEQQDARRRAIALARLLGCEEQDEDAMLRHLRQVPAEDILSCRDRCIDQEKDGYKNLYNFYFLPCSEAGTEGSGEDMVLPDTPRRLLHSNRFYPVPWILGMAEMEALFFFSDKFVRKDVVCDANALKRADMDLEWLLPPNLDLVKGSPESRAVAEGMRQLYFPAGPVTEDGYIQLHADTMFTHGVLEAARCHAAHPAAHPVYIYLFCVLGRLNRNTTLIGMPNPPGPCHGDEKGYLFGCRSPLPPEPELAPGSIEAVTRNRLTTLWTNFARTGNPTVSMDMDIEGVIWRPMDASNATKLSYLRIGQTLYTYG